MSVEKYIGTTIGPIFDTMNLAGTPASLWASSYMFSHIARIICEVLLEKGVENDDIIVPFYDDSSEEINKMTQEGVGLFHDHIIFKAGKIQVSDMKDIKLAVLDKVADAFNIDAQYLRKYIMIASVEFDVDYEAGETPIGVSAKMFDSMELSKVFPASEDRNQILDLFTGTADTYSEGRNKLIKDIVKKIGIDTNKWQLFKDGDSRNQLKEMWDIARNYYAIIRADGDDMGKEISKCKNSEEIRNFSNKCMKYCSKVSDMVKDFGGVTIFAGGDDLLAILPCVSKGNTILNFVADVNSIALKEFGFKISFGVSVFYYKYPLYEALSDSADRLFADAKSDAFPGIANKKNNTAIKIQKHSGQTVKFILRNETLDELLKIQDALLKYNASNTQNEVEQVYLSVLHKLILFKTLIKSSLMQGCSLAELKTLFSNLFDGVGENTFLHDTVPTILYKLTNDTEGKVDIIAINPEDSDEDVDRIETLSFMLRMFKFFIDRINEKREEA